MEINPSRREEAENGAARWLALREREEWGAADEAALSSWIAADLNHRAAWLRLNAAWQQSARLRAIKTTAPAGVVPAAHEMHLPFFEPSLKTPAPQDGRVWKSSFRWKRYAAVASIAIVTLTVAAVYLPSAASHYRTDIGAMKTVPLSDGSRLTLNTGTHIRVAVTEGERRISLGQGEVYFQVAKDPTRPFVVEAGGREIVAVGTAFSVRREGGDIRVLVTEGAVRVGNSQVLTAGAVVRAEGDGVLVQHKPLLEVEQALTWRSGYLTFDRTPLAAAVAEFNRYNRRQVRIEDTSLIDVPVGGSFRATNIAAFLRLIEREMPLQVVNEGGDIILEGRSSQR